MSRVGTDEARENRIVMEIVVDAYGEEEQFLGWYYYLEGKLNFPFRALLIENNRAPKEIEIVEIAPEEDCIESHDMLVGVQDDGDVQYVRLAKIQAPEADDLTQEAIADWHYWIAMGYQF
jgi:hypothetical protein